VGRFKVHAVNHSVSHSVCTPLPSLPPSLPQNRISQLEGQLARAQSVEQEAQRLSAQLATVQVGRSECLRASVLETCSSRQAGSSVCKSLLLVSPAEQAALCMRSSSPDSVKPGVHTATQGTSNIPCIQICNGWEYECYT
jgi:hypothetical protein